MAGIAKQFTDLIDANKWDDLERWDKYHRGEFERAALPSTNHSAIAREYNDLLSRADLPICSLVVSAVVDRMQVDGFRTKATDSIDEVVWDWFQQSNMDARQSMLYRDSMVYGDGYVSVTPNGDIPRLSIESPMNLAVSLDPLDPSRIEYAAKQVGSRGWLYTPDEIIAFQKLPVAQHGWQVVSAITHNAGATPIVRFSNRVDSRGRSMSEIALVAPIQRRIIQTIADRLLVQRAAAWKQRWMSGVSIERDADGNAIPPFRIGVDQLAVSESPETRFGEWDASSFKEHIDAVDMDVRQAAAVTQTPPHLLAPHTISNISAEALVALEAGLAAKVSERQLAWGESWEFALRLGGNMVGHDVPVDSETIWHDLERRSDAQRVDGALKLRSMGLPMEFLLERLGLTPLTIKRVMEQSQEEAVRSASVSAAAFGMAPGQNPADGQQSSGL